MQININLENLKRLYKLKSQEWLKGDENFTHIITKNWDDYFYYSPKNKNNIDN